MILEWIKKKIREKESGTSLPVDLLACLLVFIFCMGMIIAYMSYTKSAQLKMQIDNVGKEYIYKVEETGLMDTSMKNQFFAELEKIGCTVNKSSFQTNAGTQVDYGQEVWFQVQITIPNPLYESLSVERHGRTVVTIPGITPTISYTIERRSTSRW